MTASGLQLSLTSAHVGAEITGIDISQPLGAKEIDALRCALGEYGVLFFRNQALTPEKHMAFASAFGALDQNRLFAQVENYQSIAEVSRDPAQKSNNGRGWQTDKKT